MSTSFYHKVSYDQWKIIKPHLPKAKSTGRPRLNSRTVFNEIFGYWIPEQNGIISLKNLGMGTVFIMNFANGVISEFLKKFYAHAGNFISWKCILHFAEHISMQKVREKSWAIKILELHAAAKPQKFTYL